MKHIPILISIICGASIGALLRYAINIITHTYILPNIGIAINIDTHITKNQFWTTLLPTLFVNLLGSVVIGFIFVFIDKHIFSENIKYFLIIGLLGSFTTFSTLSLESFILLKNGHYTFALTYTLLHVFFGIFCVYVGYITASALTK